MLVSLIMPCPSLRTGHLSRPFYVHGPSSLNTLPVSLFCTVAGLTLARKSPNRGCNALILIDSVGDKVVICVQLP